MQQEPSTTPDWDRLHEVAAGQSGYFTTQQAATAGFSTRVLRKLVRAGRIEREQRAMYRLVDAPCDEFPELVPVWLWSRREGVVSHDTALYLHALGDAFPSHLHLTVPTSWRKRRVRVPSRTVLHFADVDEADRTRLYGLPITSHRRTLEDCAARRIMPDLLQHAAREAIDQGLVQRDELVEVQRVLQPFGGIG